MKGEKKMKIKLLNVILIWVSFIVLFCVILLTGYYLTNVSVNADNADINFCSAEVKMVGLPNISVVEKEQVIEVPKETEVYTFPFDVSFIGELEAKGVTNDYLKSVKEYPLMRSNEKVTVFANKSVIPEGTLVWIEGVGVRQVQSINSGDSGVLIYFEDANDAQTFGVQTLKVYEILE